MENRREPRFYLNRRFETQLVFRTHRQSLNCRLINVSRSGLCVLTRRQLPVDTQTGVKVGTEIISLRDVWSFEDFNEPSVHRYGLECLEQDCNLVATFLRHGLTSANLVEKRQNQDEEFSFQFETRV